MMMRSKLAIAIGLAVFAGAASDALAQQTQITTGRPVWENTKNGAVASRAPGRVVRRLMANTRAAHSAMINRARQGPTITDVEPAINDTTQLKADLLEIVFRDLNLAIQLLATQIGADPGTSPTPDPGTPTVDVSPLLGVPTGPER